MLKLFNTESRSIEEVKPHDGKKIRFYTCGPTVYDYAHIGNFRTFVFEDLLRKTIKFLGMEIEQVMNLTDVDDKTIRGAIAKNVSLEDFTATFKKAFFEDMQTLGIEKVEHYPAATEYIPQMITMCQALLDKGVAYKGSDGSLYFAISKFPDYGKLSHLNLDDLKKGASDRVLNDEYAKDQPADFVLWKAHDQVRDGTIFWESPFGRGRPGWHLECSVMANALLGETIDIHAGGVDLIFPHHENEIAQSECCTGKCFSRFWVHAEHLLVDGRKMSKSLGNFYTLRDLIQKGYSGKVIRFLLVQSHYRIQFNFTLQALDAAKSALQRINDFIVRLEGYNENNAVDAIDIDSFIKTELSSFTEALANDLNASEAMSVLFEMIRKVNAFCDQKKITADGAKKVLELLKRMDSVLGICSFTQEAVPADILALVEERKHARAAKDFKRSDAIRDELLQKGYVLEDSPSGARVKKI
jgi:cysteinyl-tRNA synthetase